MEGASLWGRAHNNLHAAVRCVVLAGAFFAIHVAKGVSVGLDELIVGNKLGEVGLPELLRALQVQTLSTCCW